MEQRNNSQNSVIFQVEEILNKMSNQVSFLIRKDKLMNQLDVDVLMENTRRLYDTLCSVKCNMDVDSIPMEIETFEEETKVLRNSETERDAEKETEKTEETFEEEDISSESHRISDIELSEENEPKIESENFEDNAKVEDEYSDCVFSVTEVIENDLTLDNDTQILDISITQVVEEDTMLENELHVTEEKESGIKAYKKESHTIGDMLELLEDNSLAARLQKKNISDLMTAIGINDKFLFLNELFGGSMEKYNRSIRALNNFPTLLGARTYMSELQIEFQWDCNSEAYKKLSDLIERKFG